LVGVHVHDAAGLKDHLPPGTGEIDFEAIRPHLKPETPFVIELKPGTHEDDIQKAIILMKAFLNA
jgi:sugar phosphate isomerase/epimerase